MVAIGIHIEFSYKTIQDVYALPFNNIHVYANNQILPQATLHGCVSSSHWHS